MVKLPSYNLDPLPQIDLVVAVSFGLLVPPRILKATTYGGINVHPSLLPRSAEIKPSHRCFPANSPTASEALRLFIGLY